MNNTDKCGCKTYLFPPTWNTFKEGNKWGHTFNRTVNVNKIKC